MALKQRVNLLPYLVLLVLVTEGLEIEGRGELHQGGVEGLVLLPPLLVSLAHLTQERLG